MSKGRLEAFSDGVLAVAITLLVLDLHVDPGAREGLLAQLLAAWPSFVAYIVSFLVIGVIWVNHHAIVRFVEVVDRPLLFWNLILLLFVTALPFTTATLAGALADGSASDVRVAAVLYGCTTTGFAVAFTFLYGRITKSQVTEGRMDAATRRRAIRRFGVGTVLYPVTTVIGLVSAPAMLAALAALSFYYLFNQTGASEREPRIPT
ncbi:TMEM175 family protein [Leifsonia sp. fls2-241-R2A-40a]|uniref:TMEM175 family protein n=1 Tax=Leifsonia sp. fls2-241-R2A-40a TaxID=3040290 RepID=UPI00254FDAA7|nr:TMEM175 family protein [Leifsonia sp. fls2-241-R2A-40a]